MPKYLVLMDQTDDEDLICKYITKYFEKKLSDMTSESKQKVEIRECDGCGRGVVSADKAEKFLCIECKTGKFYITKRGKDFKRTPERLKKAVKWYNQDGEFVKETDKNLG